MRTGNSVFFALFVAAVPAAVVAQSSPALDEVVVTAQRREESLRDVPISLTSISGQAIEAQNIREAQDYLMLTPRHRVVHATSPSRSAA